jgi:alpha-1,2-mannosyltransferase
MMYALIVVIGFECWPFVSEALRHDQVDFGVYRHGGVAMLHSADLYALRVGTLRLPFTYPPAAALLFAPFAWLAMRPEQAVWAVCSLLALWYVIRLSLGRYAPPRLSDSVVVGLGVFVLVAHSNPLRVGMELGQINIFLALLILADFCGIFRPVPRGVLIGVAAALKLTPAFLIVYLLVVRRYRAAAVAASTFVGVSLVAAAFAPSASWHYWARGYFADAHRTGDLSYISNQSLNGLFVRLMGSPSHGRPLWAVSAAASAVFVLWLSRRAYTERPWLSEALALSGMLVVSPVSWVHHWIIVLPLLLAALRCASEASARIRVALLCASGALSAVLLFGVVWRVPVTDERVYHQSPFHFLVGNSQVLLLLVLIFVIAVYVLRDKESRPVVAAATVVPPTAVNPVDPRSSARPGPSTR